MKVRPQRELLEDSMFEVQEIEPTRTALLDWVYKSFRGMQLPDMHSMVVQYYCYDNRIGWDTHIIYLPEWGVLGFSDAPVRSLSTP